MQMQGIFDIYETKRYYRSLLNLICIQKLLPEKETERRSNRRTAQETVSNK